MGHRPQRHAVHPAGPADRRQAGRTRSGDGVGRAAEWARHPCSRAASPPAAASARGRSTRSPARWISCSFPRDAVLVVETPYPEWAVLHEPGSGSDQRLRPERHAPGHRGPRVRRARPVRPARGLGPARERPGRDGGRDGDGASTPAASRPCCRPRPHHPNLMEGSPIQTPAQGSAHPHHTAAPDDPRLALFQALVLPHPARHHSLLPREGPGRDVQLRPPLRRARQVRQTAVRGGHACAVVGDQPGRRLPGGRRPDRHPSSVSRTSSRSPCSRSGRA